MYVRRGGLGDVADDIAYWTAQAAAAAAPAWQYTVTPAGRTVPFVMVTNTSTGAWGPWIPGGVSPASGLLSKDQVVQAIGTLMNQGAPTQYGYNGQTYSGYPAMILWALVADGVLLNMDDAVAAQQQQTASAGAAARAPLEAAALARGYRPEDFAPLSTTELRNLLCTGHWTIPCTLDPATQWVPPDPGTSPAARAAAAAAGTAPGAPSVVQAPPGFGPQQGGVPFDFPEQAAPILLELEDDGWDDDGGDFVGPVGSSGGGGYFGQEVAIDDELGAELVSGSTSRPLHWLALGAALYALTKVRK